MTTPSPLSNSVHSCDTFVVLPPGTADGSIVFGKNSDRPAGEVQEVIYCHAQDYTSGTKLKCTYIEIEQASHTYAVILSKPAWMWGAEMGANEHSVCIGNEAVWTALNGDDDSNEALLGMDLVRLGLERSTTAREALDVITSLLEKYGQGGPCSDTMPSLTYHNSFIIADRKEAWVLETAGKLWAAEHIKSGPRNISNSLSIGTNIDLMSDNLLEYAQKNRLWHPSQGELNFLEAFGDGAGDDPRYRSGKQLLAQFSASGEFSEKHMFKILRDTPSGICMSRGSFVSTGSQVSVLPPMTSSNACLHFFTATPDPQRSVFKPFLFAPDMQFTDKTLSPTFAESLTKGKRGFRTYVDRGHQLHKYHKKIYPRLIADKEFQQKMKQLEDEYSEKAEKYAKNLDADSLLRAKNIFNEAVDAEMNLYQ